VPYKSVEDYVIIQKACPLYNVTPVQLVNSLRVLSKIISDSASAVVHCHEKNVVHGDIASRNFLVSKELNAFICDFGMSLEVPVGLPHVKGRLDEQVPVKWTSPEVLSDRLYSFKSDVYAFGMFLFEVVSLGEPWAGEHLNNHTIGDCIVDPRSPRHRPNIPGYCPKQLANLMRGCWADDVHKRPSARDISKTLDEFQRSCSDATVDDLPRIYEPESPALMPTLPQPRPQSTGSVSSSSPLSTPDSQYGTYSPTDPKPTSSEGSTGSATLTVVSSNSSLIAPADDSRYEVYRVARTPSTRSLGGYVELSSMSSI